LIHHSLNMISVLNLSPLAELGRVCTIYSGQLKMQIMQQNSKSGIKSYQTEYA